MPTTTVEKIHVRILPGSALASLLAPSARFGGQSGWAVLAERCCALSKERCPVGTTGEAGGTKARGNAGKHLRDTLRWKIEPTGRALVGSSKTLQPSGVSALDVILSGTEPHPIDPVNASVLRFTSGGQVVFARHVDHPGTAANPFVQKAIQETVSRASLGSF